MAAKLDLMPLMADMRVPWLSVAGEADELSPIDCTYELAAACGAPALAPLEARAALIVVVDLGDVVDSNPGDGICSTGAAGPCTLRAAIQETNATPGLDTIAFAIGNGVQQIQLASGLPSVTSPVVIDAGTVNEVVKMGGSSSLPLQRGDLTQLATVLPLHRRGPASQRAPDVRRGLPRAQDQREGREPVPRHLIEPRCVLLARFVPNQLPMCMAATFELESYRSVLEFLWQAGTVYGLFGEPRERGIY